MSTPPLLTERKSKGEVKERGGDSQKGHLMMKNFLFPFPSLLPEKTSFFFFFFLSTRSKQRGPRNSFIFFHLILSQTGIERVEVLEGFLLQILHSTPNLFVDVEREGFNL